jgi:CBS domain-containing protein
VVVNARGGPAGLISERDLITILASGGDLDTHQAADVMTADLVAAQPGDSIASVGRLMLDAKVRHVVIRDGDSVVGLVSIRDVLAVLLASINAR